MTDIRDATRTQLANYQSGPAGTRERSGQEQAALWKKVTSLPDEDMNAMFTAMADRAGHQPGEQQPCELCNFVADHGIKELGL